MRRKAAEPSRHATRQPQDAPGRYLAALEEVYPAARGKAYITVRPDSHVIVSIPLPTRVRQRVRLLDQMAEVGTKLLPETDRYILSG